MRRLRSQTGSNLPAVVFISTAGQPLNTIARTCASSLPQFRLLKAAGGNYATGMRMKLEARRLAGSRSVDKLE